MKRLFIWGAGDIGKRVLSHLSEKWEVIFVDTNKQIGNKIYQKRNIISIEEYIEKYSDQFILIAHLHETESISVLQRNKITNYFIHCELPGDFREPYIGDFLKEYIINYLGIRTDYVLYGLGIYSLIVDDWIFTHAGIHPNIVRQDGFPNKLTEKLMQQYAGLSIIDDIQQLSGIKEICICLDDYSELEKHSVFQEYYITDIFDCTDRIISYHNPEIEKFHNLHEGLRCFIVATGPSLKMEDLNLLKEKKEICISMNSIDCAFDKTDWRPDYYVVSDRRRLDEDRGQIDSLPIKEKFISDNSDIFWKRAHEKNVNRFHQHCEYCFNKKPKFSDDFSKKSYTGTTVTYTCMQLAVYMGFKEIYLLGVDFTGGDTTDGEYSHFHAEEELVAVCYKDHVWSAYTSAKQYADEHGIKIYNATRGGKLEIFPRIDFDSLFV